MSRKTKRASPKHVKSANITRSQEALPPYPGRLKEQGAAGAEGAIKAYRNASEVDISERVGDLLIDLMHLCDRDFGPGSFDDALDTARGLYEMETEQDARDGRRGA